MKGKFCYALLGGRNMIRDIPLFKAEDLVDVLNGQRYRDLTPYLKDFLKTIFGKLTPTSVINVVSIHEKSKADLKITIGNVSRYIAVRGVMNSTLEELPFEVFIKFLEKLGVSETTISTIKLYYYLDGSEDGTGADKIPWPILKVILKRRLILANEELNKKDILNIILERILFSGIEKDYKPADVIYCGTTKYGVVATKEMVMNYLINKEEIKILDNSIHFGRIIISHHNAENSSIKIFLPRIFLFIYDIAWKGRRYYFDEEFED